ncbi:hypothetical protein CVT24_006492 [Panaeolus cyanescens]|uniref:Uncharacterized protein n=1 Tax=Panaeolus cyanescens TaxID=181874 RepID=A0A409X6D6_9AGAR|nr:hypothetical protein CVT24_006492 [Panaeolus cyanescens]
MKDWSDLYSPDAMVVDVSLPDPNPRTGYQSDEPAITSTVRPASSVDIPAGYKKVTQSLADENRFYIGYLACGNAPVTPAQFKTSLCRALSPTERLYSHFRHPVGSTSSNPPPYTHHLHFLLLLLNSRRLGFCSRVLSTALLVCSA